MEVKNSRQKYKKVLIRKCHQCSHIAEAPEELKRCESCNKAFLPLNYFEKVHTVSGNNFQSLFSHSDDLTEEDLIKGIQVIW